DFVKRLVQGRRILRERPSLKLLFSPLQQFQRVHPNSATFGVSPGTVLWLVLYSKPASPNAQRWPHKSASSDAGKADQSAIGIVLIDRAAHVPRYVRSRSIQSELRHRDARRRVERTRPFVISKSQRPDAA